jgi:hypothetical protein
VLQVAAEIKNTTFQLIFPEGFEYDLPMFHCPVTKLQNDRTETAAVFRMGIKHGICCKNTSFYRNQLILFQEPQLSDQYPGSDRF